MTKKNEKQEKTQEEIDAENKATAERERIAAENKALIEEQRKEAREAKDFEKSDELRKRLEALGYVVKDTQDGTSELTQK